MYRDKLGVAHDNPTPDEQKWLCLVPYKCNLAIAYYRLEQWKACIQTISNDSKANEHCVGKLFLAMAHAQLGDKEKSTFYFDQAESLINDQWPGHVEFQRFLAEATELLGVEFELDN